MNIGLMCGIAILIMFACLVGRQILLNPQSAAWPDAPAIVRRCMKSRAGYMLLIGLTLVLGAPAQGHVTSRLLTFFICCEAGYEVVLFVNIARQKLPVRLQDRLRQMEGVIRCSQRDWTRSILVRIRVVKAMPARPPAEVVVTLAETEVLSAEMYAPNAVVDMNLAAKLHAVS